ncbi:MAG: DUF4243 domain-containing protein [Alphaproteobacteria bacterium]|nr:DUF4243 domain-containing protein [Alphaproteobacteria bacterium]
MAMSRQDAINDALARLSDLGFTYGPNYAEHGPMAAEAISTLGYNDAVADWVEAYKKDHRPHPLPPRCQPIDDADEQQWRPALGNRSRLSDWYDHFRQELAANASHDVVRRWAPRLIDGHAGALTHGLIRTSHALRGLPVEGKPTQLQLDELARGLAYWAGTYQMPSRRVDPTPLVALPDAAQDGAGIALCRHTAFLGRVLLAHIDRPMTPVIQLVHTITSAAAIRTLLPLLPCEFAEDAYEAAQRVSADILARVVSAPPAMTNAEPPHCQLQWDDLAARAVAHRDEHVIKLTDACLHEDFIRPDPIYRAVAEAIQRCLPAWS